jgi:hypothetical protein
MAEHTEVLQVRHFSDGDRLFASEFSDGSVVVSGHANGLTASIMLSADEKAKLGSWMVAELHAGGA